MGFTFFAPIYIPNTQIKIYGPITQLGDSLEDVVGGQLAYQFFPVHQRELASEIKYVYLKEGRYDLGDGIILGTKYLNHPVNCLGYRFEYKGKVFCTAYDTEPYQNVFCSGLIDPFYDEAMMEEGEQVAAEENQKIEAFFAGADFLIHDAQYTQKEYEASKIGWGHSSYEHAIASAKRAGVKRLALFHHDPMRTDKQMDIVSEKLCKKKNPGDMEVFIAREGLKVDI
jgi:phosphoribosyl 1,2-cyclic phosphodiesterase